MSDTHYRDREGEPVSSGRSGPSPALIGFLVIAVLALIFVLANRDDVSISFWAFQIESQTWVAIAIALVIGAILDRLLQEWWRRSRG